MSTKVHSKKNSQTHDNDWKTKRSSKKTKEKGEGVPYDQSKKYGDLIDFWIRARWDPNIANQLRVINGGIPQIPKHFEPFEPKGPSSWWGHMVWTLGKFCETKDNILGMGTRPHPLGADEISFLNPAYYRKRMHMDVTSNTSGKSDSHAGSEPDALKAAPKKRVQNSSTAKPKPVVKIPSQEERNSPAIKPVMQPVARNLTEKTLLAKPGEPGDEMTLEINPEMIRANRGIIASIGVLAANESEYHRVEEDPSVIDFYQEARNNTHTEVDDRNKSLHREKLGVRGDTDYDYTWEEEAQRAAQQQAPLVYQVTSTMQPDVNSTKEVRADEELIGQVSILNAENYTNIDLAKNKTLEMIPIGAFALPEEENFLGDSGLPIAGNQTEGISNVQNETADSAIPETLDLDHLSVYLSDTNAQLEESRENSTQEFPQNSTSENSMQGIDGGLINQTFSTSTESPPSSYFSKYGKKIEEAAGRREGLKIQFRRGHNQDKVPYIFQENAEIENAINIWINQVRKDACKPSERCEGEQLKNALREDVRRYLIGNDPQIVGDSKAQQDYLISRYLTYFIESDPKLHKIMNAFPEEFHLLLKSDPIASRPIEPPPHLVNITASSSISARNSTFAPSRVGSLMALLDHVKNPKNIHSGENLSPFEEESVVIRSWITYLRIDYKKTAGSEALSKCQEACTMDLVRKDVSSYFAMKEPNWRTLSKLEQEVAISKFLVDLVYVQSSEGGPIVSQQGELQNKTIAEARQFVRDSIKQQWKGVDFSDIEKAAFQDAYFDIYAPFLKFPNHDQIENVTYGSNDHVNAAIGMVLAKKYGVEIANYTDCLCVTKQVDRLVDEMPSGEEKDKLETHFNVVRAIIDGTIRGKGPEIEEALSGNDTEAKTKFITELMANDTSLPPHVQKLIKIEEELLKVKSEFKKFLTFEEYLVKKLESKGIHANGIIPCGRKPVSINFEKFADEQEETLHQGYIPNIIFKFFNKNTDPSKSQQFYCRLSSGDYTQDYTQFDAYNEYAQSIDDSLKDMIQNEKKDLLLSIQLLLGNEKWVPKTVYMPKAEIREQAGDHRLPHLWPNKKIIEVSNGKESKLILASDSRNGMNLKLEVLNATNANHYISNNPAIFFDETARNVTRTLPGMTSFFQMGRINFDTTGRQERIRCSANSITGTPDTVSQYLFENSKLASDVREEAERIRKVFHQTPLWRYFVSNFVPFGACFMLAFDNLGISHRFDTSVQANVANTFGCIVDGAFAFFPIKNFVSASLKATGKAVVTVTKGGYKALKNGGAMLYNGRAAMLSGLKNRKFGLEPLAQVKKMVQTERIVSKEFVKFYSRTSVAGVSSSVKQGWVTRVLNFPNKEWTMRTLDVFIPRLPGTVGYTSMDSAAWTSILSRFCHGQVQYGLEQRETKPQRINVSSP